MSATLLVMADNPPSATPVESAVPAEAATGGGAVPAEVATAAAQAKPAGKAKHVHPPRPTPPILYRDTNQYPPLQLTWNPSTDFDQVLGVYTHPSMNRRAVLATATGVHLTNDYGKTWSTLAEATAEKVGPILSVAFDPVLPDTFYLASKTKGVWATTDQGKTFRQIGTKATGMASDTVVSLLVYGGDPSRQTLLAVHGAATTGISRTQDIGKTWDIVNTDYRFTRLFGAEGNLRKIFLFGSTEKQHDIQCVYSCTTIGEYLAEVVRDVAPTDLVSAPTFYRKPPLAYLTTLDGGVNRIQDTGSSGLAFDAKPLAMPGVDGWYSVGLACGPSADITNLYLYDPTKLGLVVSSDEMATTQTASDGLPVSSLVKEGAVIRPNANGTVFYAVTNGALSIGRVPEDVPVVEFTPSALEVNAREQNQWKDLATAFSTFASSKDKTIDAAKSLLKDTPDPAALYHVHELVVTARLPLKPTPPTSVTIDLSRCGGSPQTQLFDDGQHHDGAAGDGLYGFDFAFNPVRATPKENSGDWRGAWPGHIAMGVTATYADGSHRGAVGVLGVYTQTMDNMVWDAVAKKPADAGSVEGDVTITPFGIPRPSGHGHPIAAIRIEVKKGPWTVHLKTNYKLHDLNGYEAISFWIKVESGETPKELYAQLRDTPEFSPPTTTARIPILNDLGLTADYQRVDMLINDLLAQSPQFQSDRLGEIIISGEATAPVTLSIEGMQILAREDSNPSDPAAQ